MTTKVYNQALDLMGLALASVMENKPNSAVKALAAAAKHPQAAKALAAIVKANVVSQEKPKVEPKVLSARRALAARIRANVDQDPDLDLDLAGEEQRIEVEEADAFDDELLEDFEEAMARKHTAKKKAKAEDEGDDDEDESEDEGDDDEDEDDDKETSSARVSRQRLQRAMANLARQRR